MANTFLVPMHDAPLVMPALPAALKKARYYRSSCSQLRLAADLWVYQYLILSQEQRNALPANVKMQSGSIVGELLQRVLCSDKVLAKMQSPHQISDKMSHLTLEQACEVAIVQSREIVPRDTDSDREQKARHLEMLNDVLVNAVEGFDGSRYGTIIAAEKEYIWYWQGLFASALGYADLVTSTHVIEFKTKWPSRGSVKKDGTRGFSAVKAPATPERAHIAQVSCYALASGKKPVLYYAGERGTSTFDGTNCEDLEEKNLQDNVSAYYLTARSRERMLLAVDGDVDRMVEMTQPDFGNFMWDLPAEHVAEAHRKWEGT